MPVLLFAQAAIARAACDMPVRTPALAIAQEPAMPCHEEPAAPRNVCLAHCLSTDQSADTPQVVVPVWLGVAPLFVPVASAASAHSVAVLRRVPVPSAAPPPRILFQSFLI